MSKTCQPAVKYIGAAGSIIGMCHEQSCYEMNTFAHIHTTNGIEKLNVGDWIAPHLDGKHFRIVKHDDKFGPWYPITIRQRPSIGLSKLLSNEYVKLKHIEDGEIKEWEGLVKNFEWQNKYTISFCLKEEPKPRVIKEEFYASLDFDKCRITFGNFDTCDNSIVVSIKCTQTGDNRKWEIKEIQ